MSRCGVGKTRIQHHQALSTKRVVVADDTNNNKAQEEDVLVAQDEYWVGGAGAGGENSRRNSSDRGGCFAVGNRLLRRFLFQTSVTTTALVWNNVVAVPDKTGERGDHATAAAQERDNNIVPFRDDEDHDDDNNNNENIDLLSTTNEVCFLPDLHALRFWSHPRSTSSDPTTFDDDYHNNNNNKNHPNHHHRHHHQSIIMLASEDRPADWQPPSPSPSILQGVLWKRRDIFTNRWRPRWFVLHPSQGLMTYYLLDETVSQRLAAAESASSAILQATTTLQQQPTTTSDASSSSVPRRRTSSWDSLGGVVSENAVDYDVVPRGTIYLVGCTVTVNETLSKPNQQQLFALTIRPPSLSDAPHVHLAARSATVRDAWVQRLQQVCRQCPDVNVTATTTMTTLEENVPDNAPPETIITTTTTTNEAAAAATTTTVAEETTDADGGQSGNVVVISNSRPQWTRLGSASRRLYDNVPPVLAQRIQTVIDETLPILSLADDEEPLNLSSPWKEVFRQEGGGDVIARWYWRKTGTTTNSNDQGDTPPMLYATAVLEQQSPYSVFDVLVDPDQQTELDASVNEAARLHVLNPHTFYEYCSYRAAWPTSPRELVTVLHWQVVVQKKQTSDDKEEEEERAILIVSFSCPEADQVRGPPAEGHVRAKLHVCMTLLQPKLSSSSSSSVSCLVKRVLSVDMGGFQVGFPWTNIMLTQRASFLVRLADYLQQQDERQDRPLPTTTTRSAMVDDEICQKIILRQGTYDNQRDAHRRSPGRQRTESREDTDNDDGESLVIDDTKYRNGKKRLSASPKAPSVVTQAILLFVPVAVAKFVVLLELPYPSLWFFLCVFVMIRRIVLLHLGDYIPLNGPDHQNTEQSRRQLTGPVTCRFQVDLKGVLRFITNKKEEREELKTGTAEVSVVHIVACAVARALRDEPQLNKRRFSIPWLFIDVLCLNSHPDDGVSVTISENEGEPITLKSVDKSGVQTVADQLAQLTKVKEQQQELGQCLVMATTNYDQIDMETDTAPIDPSVRVVAVIGGVRLEHNPHPARRASHGLPPNHNRSLRPVLALSLTMGGPAGCPGMGSVDFVTCRRFAEEVQKLLQFPEMCDNQ